MMVSYAYCHKCNNSKSQISFNYDLGICIECANKLGGLNKMTGFDAKPVIAERNAIGKLHADPIWQELFEQKKEIERQMDRLFDKYLKQEIKNMD